MLSMLLAYGDAPVTVGSVLEFDPAVAIIAAVVVLLVTSAAYATRRGGTDGWSMNSLTDDQRRVITYIRENDGEVSQKSVSTEFDWSDAKTSRVTSELTDTGAVEKVRKDRQNYIKVNEEESNGTIEE